MRVESVARLVLLSIVTLGIYAIVWAVRTKNQMNTAGADIPSAWWMIVPIVSFWWTWRYAQGVEHVTRGKMSAAVAFLLLLLLGVIGMAVIQAEFNKVASGRAAAQPAALAL